MNYIEAVFLCNPHSEIITEVLSAELADIGFESFVDTETGSTAYIQESLYNKEAIDLVLENFPLESKITYTVSLIEGRDWNEEWEKNYFKPLIIDDRCIIQSTFHNEPASYEYNIYIDPKMAFGTGHHQTTELMIREILNMDFTGKSVLDMGCGTAILGILASMRGADPILAIDIDEWAYDNAKENLDLNKVSNIDVQIGGADLLTGAQTFDVILANINRNILLNDIHVYASVLNPEGILFMSGFYTEDIPALTDECNKHGLTFVHSNNKDNWANVKFIKKGLV
ncbi:ribosomal protein L11 methyltransferase [Dysgonomonas alginatilytica]|uniref:Ribosomal protein L11 methyltransferase n=1 Tax=Dysgonomonas alginatilytica TaxID=1605892 RepID=A0A2V3PS40_9BACT|nr:50S ribosomal protein L11 methyltransferase [Dysgonomonas alginatilytica]PXV67405.1 ribosomal protein L11 methyltransferase [Dysgonomonas alginatilytica]